MENSTSNLPGILGLIVFVLFIAVFYAGAAKKVVIYYDYKDLFISIGALFTPFLLFFLWQEESNTSELAKTIIYWVANPLLGLLSIFLIYLNFKNGIFHNRNIPIGIIVGIFKLTYVILAFTIIFAQFSESKDRRRSFGDVIIAALIVGLAVWITTVLVNGKEVYKQKGWALPVTL